MCARPLVTLKARQPNALLKYALKKSASFFRSFVQRIERIIRRLAACDTKLDVASNDNNLEQEFDALLRQHVKKHGAANPAACEGFAAEQAGAYLEQALSKTAMTTYEEHLTACASCRHHVIELSRLLPAGTNENLATSPNEPTFGQRFFKLFFGWRLGALAGLGVATTALLLFFVSTSNKNSDTMVAADRPSKIVSATSESPAQVLDEIARNKVGEMQIKSAASPVPGLAVAPLASVAKSAPSVVASSAATPPPPVVAGAANQAAPLLPKPALAAEELKRESSRDAIAQNQNQTQLRTDNWQQQRALPTPTPRGPSANQMQADLDLKGREMKPLKELAKAAPAQSAEDKARVAEVAEIRAEDNVIIEKGKDAEKAKRKSSVGGRAMPTAKAAPAPAREINGKNFRLENGIWVDTQYNAGAGLAVARLKYNSDEYKRVLKDTPDLKSWFALKSVIVVWQGKIYRVDK